MRINKIQAAIFKKMAKEQSLDVDDFIRKFSNHYLGREIEEIGQITENEADKWINQAYLESLEK